MKPPDLDIYRDLYPEILNDIWDKITERLTTGYGLLPETAEYAALLIVEWIRSNWGGQIQVARRLTDPRPQKQPALLDDGPVLIDVPATQAPMVSDRYRQFFDQVVSILANIGVRWNTPLPDVARDITVMMQRDFRGEYITKVPKLDQLQRDFEIWRKFNGPENMDGLVQKTGLSAMRIYQIRAEIQRRKDKYEQPLLPL